MEVRTGEGLGVLDELRARLDDGSSTWETPFILLEVDTFEREHPFLVDLSTCGPQCPAYCDFNAFGKLFLCRAQPEWCEWDQSHGYKPAPTGQPCPVLKERK